MSESSTASSFTDAKAGGYFSWLPPMPVFSAPFTLNLTRRWVPTYSNGMTFSLSSLIRCGRETLRFSAGWLLVSSLWARGLLDLPVLRALGRGVGDPARRRSCGCDAVRRGPSVVDTTYPIRIFLRPRDANRDVRPIAMAIHAAVRTKVTGLCAPRSSVNCRSLSPMVISAFPDP